MTWKEELALAIAGFIIALVLFIGILLIVVSWWIV